MGDGVGKVRQASPRVVLFCEVRLQEIELEHVAASDAHAPYDLGRPPAERLGRVDVRAAIASVRAMRARADLLRRRAQRVEALRDRLELPRGRRGEDAPQEHL